MKGGAVVYFSPPPGTKPTLEDGDMWTSTHLKCPDDSDWLAVVRVTPEGDATLISYLGDIPDDFEREIDAVQQRWTERATWPGDPEVQSGARIRDYVKFPEDADG